MSAAQSARAAIRATRSCGTAHTTRSRWRPLPITPSYRHDAWSENGEAGALLAAAALDQETPGFARNSALAELTPIFPRQMWASQGPAWPIRSDGEDRRARHACFRRTAGDLAARCAAAERSGSLLLRLSPVMLASPRIRPSGRDAATQNG